MSPEDPKVSRSLKAIEEASRKYRMPFVLAFSGGKDSTATLSLMLKARELSSFELYVAYADTLLEHPALHREALEALESLKGIEGVHSVVLRPAEGEDYISMMLEKGYPAPSWYFRWCVDRLKIRPVKRFMKSMGTAVAVLGVRADESLQRSRTASVNGSRPLLVEGRSPTLRPIIEWTEADVVRYLKSERRWDGKTFDYLLSLYGYGTGGSCGPNAFCSFGIGEEQEAHRKGIRFGCWLCTVVKRNRMPIDPVLEYARERLRSISDDPKNRIYLEGRPRKLTLEARKEIAGVLLNALEKSPEAFGYDREKLKQKLESFLKR